MIMLKHIFPLLFIVLITAGCSSTPNVSLEQARTRYISAQSNPQIAHYAVDELNKANEALTKANRAWEKDEDSIKVDHLAYLAIQRTAIAEETAKQKAAEEKMEDSDVTRTQVQLDARTQEAETAKMRAAELEAQLAALHAKKTDRGLIITLEDVLFDTDKADLKSGGLRNIQQIAQVLQQYPERNVLIEGFTDSTGSDSYNQQLSERRANSVRMALVSMGIAPNRISQQGYGEYYPVADNATAAGRQLNRRVEIIFSDESGNIPVR